MGEGDVKRSSEGGVRKGKKPTVAYPTVKVHRDAAHPVSYPGAQSPANPGGFSNKERDIVWLGERGLGRKELNGPS